MLVPYNSKNWLGTDKHGFNYFMGDDNYVYQQYPHFDYFRNGMNMRGQNNGSFCSGPAWDRQLHKICVIED